MIRCRIPVASALVLLLGCANGVEEGSSDPDAIENRFVGGWDGSQTSGTTVMLLREGLSGTLSAASLGGISDEYRIAYDVSGTLDEQTQDVTLELGCSEVSSRPMPTDEADMMADESWGALDCAGWELALACGLAGDCEGGDCNMICDVIHFGDAYATAEIPLTSIEDELDFWERV
jgi:hypothetical protein